MQELESRAGLLAQLAETCRLCPRACSVARSEGRRGDCGAGQDASLFSYGPHHGEEYCLSGWRGSGTLFFGHCNLHCVFCQNYDISQEHGQARLLESNPEAVAAAMLKIQQMGCHNANWVSPTHSIHSIVQALTIAVEAGFRLPIVYNTNGYDSMDVLRLLDGIVDIYMPDLKYADESIASELSEAPGYVAAARTALEEMHRQVGSLVTDTDGIARHGLLIRHLVLPDNLSGTEATLKWIAETLGVDTAVNLMSQYHPAWRAKDYPRLSRRLKADEYESAVKRAQQLGFRNLITQPLSFPY